MQGITNKDFALRYRGKIAVWHDDKGYGFIVPEGGGDRVFVHITSFKNPARRPVAGDVVTYRPTIGKDGRNSASKVTFSTAVKNTAKRKSRLRLLGGSFTLGFCGLLIFATLSGRLPLQLFAVYLLTSLLSIAVYAKDKYAATHHKWRTKESTLYILGLIGGWPGAYWAQTLFRHKTKKVQFQMLFWLTAAINSAGLAFLLTENGAGYIAWIEPIGWASISHLFDGLGL